MTSYTLKDLVEIRIGSNPYSHNHDLWCVGVVLERCRVRHGTKEYDGARVLFTAIGSGTGLGLVSALDALNTDERTTTMLVFAKSVKKPFKEPMQYAVARLAAR